MIFDDFELNSMPFFSKVYCKKCGDYCKTVPNGFLSKVFFCEKCEIVYDIKLVKVRKDRVSNEFIEQCHKSVQRQTEDSEPIIESVMESIGTLQRYNDDGKVVLYGSKSKDVNTGKESDLFVKLNDIHELERKRKF